MNKKSTNEELEETLDTYLNAYEKFPEDGYDQRKYARRAIVNTFDALNRELEKTEAARAQAQEWLDKFQDFTNDANLKAMRAEARRDLYRAQLESFPMSMVVEYPVQVSKSVLTMEKRSEWSTKAIREWYNETQKLLGGK